MEGVKSAETRGPDDFATLEAAFVATAENLAFLTRASSRPDAGYPGMPIFPESGRNCRPGH